MPQVLYWLGLLGLLRRLVLARPDLLGFLHGVLDIRIVRLGPVALSITRSERGQAKPTNHEQRA